MKEIVQDGDPVLREKASKVSVEDIKSDKVQSLIKDLHEILSAKELGVALASPQIGHSLRIFVVANKVFEEAEEEKKVKNPLVYINPKITKTSKKVNELEEGCLSVEGYFGMVSRAHQVTIEAYDEHGTKFTRGASGLLAQIFQHEIDHLNGILYTDHAHSVRKVDDSSQGIVSTDRSSSQDVVSTDPGDEEEISKENRNE